MEYIIIRNAYKARVKSVFDYMEADELRNPLPHQKAMLEMVCDGVEFIKADHWNYKQILIEHCRDGDYLFYIGYGNTLRLVGACPPKSKKLNTKP